MSLTVKVSFSGFTAQEAPVKILGGFGSPLAVFRTISHIVVFPIYAMLVRPFTHILKKIRKSRVSAPSIAYSNSSPAIESKIRSISVIAPIQHISVAAVFPAMIETSSMLSLQTAYASAGACHAIFKIIGSYKGYFAAIASAFPSRLTIGSYYPSNSDQVCELLVS